MLRSFSLWTHGRWTSIKPTTTYDLPDLQIQLQVDPGLQQNLFAYPLNQPQALIARRAAVGQ